MICDFHTHNLKSEEGIINVMPGFDAFEPDKVYSAGIHPWHAGEATEADFANLEELASREDVWAIGEAGLDRLRGGEMSIQEDVFRRQIELSERLGKPMIIHCLRCAQQLLEMRAQFKAKQPWVWHGFRGGASQMFQLAKKGIRVSFGPKFNISCVAAVPQELLLAETDDSGIDINTVIASLNRGDKCIYAKNILNLFRKG